LGRLLALIFSPEAAPTGGILFITGYNLQAEIRIKGAIFKGARKVKVCFERKSDVRLGNKSKSVKAEIILLFSLRARNSGCPLTGRPCPGPKGWNRSSCNGWCN